MAPRNIIQVVLLAIAGVCCDLFMFLRWPGERDAIRWIGLVVSLIGLAGVISARCTLGRSFSVRAKATRLVTGGLYSRIRNPIYVSGMFFIAGMIIMLRMPLLALVFVILIPVQIRRARQEASVLESTFGDEYRRYRARTWF